MHLRRAQSFLLRFEPRPALDVAAMLRGRLDVSVRDRLVAVSALTRRSHPLDETALRILAAVPGDRWAPLDEVVERSGSDPEQVGALARAGLLLSDGDDPDFRALRERDERLRALAWDDAALHYHLASRSEDVDAWAGRSEWGSPGGATGPQPGASEEPTGPEAVVERFHGYARMTAALAESLQANAAWFGPAPDHFHEVADALDRQQLSVPKPRGRLFRILEQRTTTRLFDPERSTTRDELSTLLYYTFGCRGTARLVDGVVGLRKTSPSGGALHPIEAYPLVLRVDGLAPGLYHYNVGRHGLDLLRELDLDAGERLAELFTLGQSYFRSAHVLVLLVARFYRNFWKYRKAQKSYRVIHVDAGHLSQTFYLVATELGLGAFYTGAINDANIDRELGLDGVEQAAIGICGCGHPWQGGSSLALETEPWSPDAGTD